MHTLTDELLLTVAFLINALEIGTAILSVIGSVRSRYNTSLVVCAWISVSYAVFTWIAIACEYFTNDQDFGDDMFLFGPLALLIGLAGTGSLLRIRQNRLARSAQSNS
jgi:hypothetical protein